MQHIPIELIKRFWLVQVCIDMHQSALRWNRDEASGLAAGVAYYLALSLFPTMLLLSAGIGLFLRFTELGQDAQSQILQVVAQHSSPIVARQIMEVLSQLRDQSTVSGPAGILGAVLAAIGVFNQFERAMDRIWGIKLPECKTWKDSLRRILTERVVAFFMLISLGTMLVLVFVCNLALTAVHTWASEYFPRGERVIAWLEMLVTIGLNAFLFANLYRGLAKQRVAWRDALRGGLLVALVWEGGRQLLGLFLIGMRYTAAYGVIGSFIALLLWCYYGVSMILFGAEYIQVLEQRRKNRRLALESQAPKQTDHASQAPQILSINTPIEPTCEDPSNLGIHKMRPRRSNHPRTNGTSSIRRAA